MFIASHPTVADKLLRSDMQERLVNRWCGKP
jgi:hypothetical protein